MSISEIVKIPTDEMSVKDAINLKHQACDLFGCENCPLGYKSEKNSSVCSHYYDICKTKEVETLKTAISA